MAIIPIPVEDKMEIILVPNREKIPLDPAKIKMKAKKRATLIKDLVYLIHSLVWRGKESEAVEKVKELIKLLLSLEIDLKLDDLELLDIIGFLQKYRLPGRFVEFISVGVPIWLARKAADSLRSEGFVELYNSKTGAKIP